MTFHRLFVFLPLVLAACSSTATEDATSSGPIGAQDAGRPGQIGAPASGQPANASGETYAAVQENDFVETSAQTTSTFAVDVDTGSYSLMRRDVTAGHLPTSEGVRSEEYVNYFEYAYPQPQDGRPFSVTLDGAPSMFGENLHLVRVGLQGQIVNEQDRKPANLVFLVDVSGSMQASNKLPLVQYALKQLVKHLAPSDTLGIVTYAGYEKVLIAPTAVSNKAAILDAIDGLSAGGSTNGEGGIRKAYQLAEAAQQQYAVNRRDSTGGMMLSSELRFAATRGSRGERSKPCAGDGRNGGGSQPSGSPLSYGDGVVRRTSASRRSFM